MSQPSSSSSSSSSSSAQPLVCMIPPTNASGITLPAHLACETDCEKLLATYLECARAHRNGMTAQDECAVEKLAYRTCTKRESAIHATKK
jgi:hypothetical protein